MVRRRVLYNHASCRVAAASSATCLDRVRRAHTACHVANNLLPEYFSISMRHIPLRRSSWRIRLGYPASSVSRSARVMSDFLSRAPRITAACASILPERRSPPCRLGVASPAVLESTCCRIALDALTDNGQPPGDGTRRPQSPRSPACDDQKTKL